MADFLNYLISNIFRIFPASAADVFSEGFGGTLGKITAVTGYKNVPANYLPTYIGVLIGWTAFLGVTIVVQIILAGYEYMTAQDNEEKVSKAKARIRNVILAGIILVGGYILAAVVVTFWTKFTGYGG